MFKKGKIAVAMSGGIDSSVSALILKNEGYEVTGVNLNLWSCFKTSKVKSCCSPDDRLDAGSVCEKLGITFMSVDMREEFKDKIIMQFVDEYSCGRTPNPCIRCNTLIKFGALMKWVNAKLGIDLVATGHYARLSCDSNMCFHLLKGADKTKDQSYFLYDMPKDALSKIIFPMGEITKKDARKIAKESGLPVAEKAESQEVCFVPDGDVASFIEDYYPEYSKSGGNFVDINGKVLGRHRGTHAYTIGQRRGLGIGFGARKYVVEIRSEKGEVVLGGDEDLFSRECRVSNLNMLEDAGQEFEACVNVRFRSDAMPATVELHGNGDASVRFDEAVRAITPGQAAVFYKDDLVLGGGWIC